MTRDRPLSDDDMLIWRRVARTARPLPGRKLPEAPKKSAAPAKPAGVLSPAPAMHPRAETGPAPKKPAPPAELSGEKRVRRGKLEVEAKLDLHGMTQAQARAALGRFVAKSRIDGMRVVLVVTGKGRGGEGALRRAAPEWLAEEAAHVAGYAPAHARHGGSGAFYVRLRRPPAAP